MRYRVLPSSAGAKAYDFISPFGGGSEGRWDQIDGLSTLNLWTGSFIAVLLAVLNVRPPRSWQYQVPSAVFLVMRQGWYAIIDGCLDRASRQIVRRFAMPAQSRRMPGSKLHR